MRVELLQREKEKCMRRQAVRESAKDVKNALSEKYYAMLQESFEEEDYYEFTRRKLMDCMQCPQ